MRTAAVELARTHPGAVCVALHPGTVDGPLTRPFGKTGLEVQTPQLAAERILGVLDGLEATQTGLFFDHRGGAVPF